MTRDDHGMAGSPWRIHWPGLAAAVAREITAETLRTIRTTRNLWRKP